MRIWTLIGLSTLVACKDKSSVGVVTDTGGAPAVDNDGDGYGEDVDCDDDDAAIHPDADELCDGINNDCDGGIDEEPVDGDTFYMDGDGDGYGDASVSLNVCDRPPGFITQVGDCDDSEPSAHPGAEEVCNDGVDNNCNGDETECVLGGTMSASDAAAVVYGAASGDASGTSVAGVGDVDGDGFDDLLIGGPRQDSRGTDAGAAWLMRGPLSGETTLASATAVLVGGAAAHNAGNAVAAAGDVDGDGYNDLIVGAWHAKGGGNDSGEAYLVFGPVTGELILYNATLRVVGEYAYDAAGTSVSGGGDLDGDGVADLIVGATGFGDDGDQSRGAAYVVSGALSGTIDLSDASARVAGSDRYDRVGTDVFANADLNGDGHADLLTSGYSWPDNDGIGGAFAFFGPLSGELELDVADAALTGVAEEDYVGTAISAGDINGDGSVDVVIGASSLSTTDDEQGAVYVVYGPIGGDLSLGSADAVLLGASARDAAGTDVAADGDADADGRNDVLVGAIESDLADTDAGAAWMFYGPVSGTVSAASADFTLTGAVARDNLGVSVGFAGDLGGDGVGDLVIGAAENDDAASSAGATYVVFGSTW